MTIVAGGDSFVWGSELADSPHGGPDGYSRNTFAALLSENYICAAYPGNGNDAIARNTIITGPILPPPTKPIINITPPRYIKTFPNPLLIPFILLCLQYIVY